MPLPASGPPPFDVVLDTLEDLVRHAPPCRAPDRCTSAECQAIQRAVTILAEHRPKPDPLGDLLAAWDEYEGSWAKPGGERHKEALARMQAAVERARQQREGAA
jgi:hypothetical protein